MEVIKNFNRNLYVTTMLLNGDPESNSYILGVFDNELSAINEGDKEQVKQNNLYTSYVKRVTLNGIYPMVHIKTPELLPTVGIEE